MTLSLLSRDAQALHHALVKLAKGDIVGKVVTELQHQASLSLNGDTRQLMAAHHLASGDESQAKSALQEDWWFDEKGNRLSNPVAASKQGTVVVYFELNKKGYWFEPAVDMKQDVSKLRERISTMIATPTSESSLIDASKYDAPKMCVGTVVLQDGKSLLDYGVQLGSLVSVVFWKKKKSHS